MSPLRTTTTLTNPVLTTVAIRYEHDVVMARQRARQIAALLGFDNHDQVRIATAVSEIARNAFRYVGRGKAEFIVATTAPLSFQIRISDEGSGIANLDEVLGGKYVSRTGMGMGILGARRLMDEFQINSTSQGTIITIGKYLPPKVKSLSPEALRDIGIRLAANPPQDPFEELQRQNQELLRTLEELQRRQNELAQLNKELEDTNRGVVALYSELDERADYLRRASELKTQFLSNMTHEFRTPLNSIISLSRMLMERIDGELSEEQEKQVRFIQRAANDLAELVNDLLDLAKVEAGKVTISPAEFQVEDLFGALRGMLKPLLASNSAVTLIFEDAAGLPPLDTDETKVSQILRNLISNALKFTEHGEVRITATMDDRKFAVFQVSDTGIGISAEDRERIFEEFTQVEGPHQRGKKGTGLGLPLSRKLAELLGGTLTVSSELNHGSVFTLRVPANYRGLQVRSDVPVISGDLDPSRIPVLLIEDNQETVFVYDKYLRGSGFQPIPAPTLKQARDALDRFRPGAIILDIILSHENSWNFLSELKQQSSTRDIPVLVITMVENEHKAIALGATAFHSKPVDREWLVKKLGAEVKWPKEELLVVDDNEAGRYLLKASLSETRFTVSEASGGQQALELASSHRFAAIFLDLMMPDMNGFEVLKALRANPKTAETPVIIHTSKTLSPAEQKRLKAQNVPVLAKDDADRLASAAKIREALVSILKKAKPPSKAHVP